MRTVMKIKRALISQGGSACSACVGWLCLQRAVMKIQNLRQKHVKTWQPQNSKFDYEYLEELKRATRHAKSRKGTRKAECLEVLGTWVSTMDTIFATVEKPWCAIGERFLKIHRELRGAGREL